MEETSQERMQKRAAERAKLSKTHGGRSMLNERDLQSYERRKSGKLDGTTSRRIFVIKRGKAVSGTQKLPYAVNSVPRTLSTSAKPVVHLHKVDIVSFREPVRLSDSDRIPHLFKALDFKHPYCLDRGITPSAISSKRTNKGRSEGGVSKRPRRYIRYLVARHFILSLAARKAHLDKLTEADRLRDKVATFKAWKQACLDHPVSMRQWETQGRFWSDKHVGVFELRREPAATLFNVLKDKASRLAKRDGRNSDAVLAELVKDILSREGESMIGKSLKRCLEIGTLEPKRREQMETVKFPRRERASGTFQKLFKERCKRL